MNDVVDVVEAMNDVVEAYVSVDGRQGTGVKVKMVFDCLEEAHGCLLGKRLSSLRRGFLQGIDYVCIMHGDWLTPSRPSLIRSVSP